MRVLVTGADGFVGKHLCRHLRESGDEVIEAGGPRPEADPGGSKAGQGEGPSAGLALDITDGAAVRAAVEAARPEGVIHLAGFSSVGKSYQDPARVFSVNTVGTVSLLSALRDLAPKARTLVISSAEVYGPVEVGTRAGEDHPLRPLSPYAASKAAAEIASFQMHRSTGLPVVCARSFNHIGPGQHPSFVVPSFAAQLGAIRRGEAPPVVKVGDLSPIRDFSHVLDVVEAYRILLYQGAAGEAYNVCSGVPRTIRSLLDQLVAVSGVAARIEVDPSRVRPSELPSLVGDAAKLQRLGWRPRRSVDGALEEIVDRLEARAAGEG